ncbi:MAG: HRDC domain-containing protein [Bacteroidia bacterium]
MSQQSTEAQRINIRDFAVWVLGATSSRRMTAENLLESWKQVRPHHTADAYDFGDLTSFVNHWWKGCLALFRQEGWLKLNTETNNLHLTPMGQDYLSAPETLLATHKKLTTALTHTLLEARLLALRHTLCKQTELPPFRIFPDTLLAQLLIHRPTTYQELEKISGMGTYKLRKYGQQLLEILAP